MPVYFGYERIVEGRTYIGELSGQPKQKESVFGLIKSTIAVLRSKLGNVNVNLGRPIPLDALLWRHNPEWRTHRRRRPRFRRGLDRRRGRRSRVAASIWKSTPPPP